MKANGASASRRFSARLKCTRPTRFQAGFRPFRKLCRSVFAAASDAASAAAISRHSARSTSGVRYSAPAIIGAVSTSEASSASRRRRDLRHTRRPAGRLQAQRRHVARREAAPPEEDRRQGLPTSPAPSRSRPWPLPRANASARRAAMRSSSSGASADSSRTRWPCGVRRRLGRDMRQYRRFASSGQE